MKKLLPFLLFLLFAFKINAQQLTNYTQYTMNRFALNPAVAGLVACSEFTTGFKRQWAGFEGSPSHTFGSYHTRLNKDDLYPKSFHGVGAFVSNDRNGFYNNSRIKLAYSYHIKLNKKYHASVGIFAGIHQQKFNVNDVRVQNRSQDPVIIDAEKSGYVYPEISPGAFVYNSNFYLGLSYFQIFPTRIKFYGTKENRLAGHTFLTAGYRFRGKDFHFTPSMLISFTPFVSPTVDLTMTLDYKQKLSVALGSKYLNSGYLSLQFNLSSSIAVGYSFEYALNEISNVAPTSHELILRFKTCKANSIERKVLCPAYQ